MQIIKVILNCHKQKAVKFLYELCRLHELNCVNHELCKPKHPQCGLKCAQIEHNLQLRKE